MNERKTVLKTFRLTESLARSLEKQAADEGTTVNAYVNSIISQHSEWSEKAREFGIASIPKSLLRSLTEAVDDETLARIGREVLFPTWKEMVEFWTQDTSPDGFLKFMSFRSRFSPASRTRITQEGDTCTLVSHSDFGPKWSIVEKSALRELVNKAFHVEPRIGGGDRSSRSVSRSIHGTCQPDRNKT
jgi:hypothetical protein